MYARNCRSAGPRGPAGSWKNASSRLGMSEPWNQTPASSNVVAQRKFGYCNAFTKLAGTSVVTASVGAATAVTGKGIAQLSTLAADPTFAGKMVTLLCLYLARNAHANLNGQTRPTAAMVQSTLGSSRALS